MHGVVRGRVEHGGCHDRPTSRLGTGGRFSVIDVEPCRSNMKFRMHVIGENVGRKSAIFDRVTKTHQGNRLLGWTVLIQIGSTPTQRWLILPDSI